MLHILVTSNRDSEVSRSVGQGGAVVGGMYVNLCARDSSVDVLLDALLHLLVGLLDSQQRDTLILILIYQFLRILAIITIN